LIENEVALFDQIVPQGDVNNDEKQYFSRFMNKGDSLVDELDKVCKDFQGQLQDILESVFNRENIQGRGGGGDKKSDEDRRAEQ